MAQKVAFHTAKHAFSATFCNAVDSVLRKEESVFTEIMQ